ncbi:MAG: methyltransferase domain-containing protein [bacterium]|nr:methyltransferase domain-containing protein [bacterium]
MRLARHTMYTKIFGALPLPIGGKVLGISSLKFFRGSRHYTPPVKVFTDDAEIIEKDYPEIHICDLPFEDNTFDYVIADQVLEHVEGNPQKAVDEVQRILKPGGTAVLTTVFMYQTHWGPKDFWRFSPDGLKYLSRDFSKIVECGGWGNRWLHLAMLTYRKVLDWEVPKRKLSFTRWLTETNDERFPTATWIIAKK